MIAIGYCSYVSTCSNEFAVEDLHKQIAMRRPTMRGYLRSEACVENLLKEGERTVAMRMRQSSMPTFFKTQKRAYMRAAMTRRVKVPRMAEVMMIAGPRVTGSV